MRDKTAKEQILVLMEKELTEKITILSKERISELIQKLQESRLSDEEKQEVVNNIVANYIDESSVKQIDDLIDWLLK